MSTQKTEISKVESHILKMNREIQKRYIMEKLEKKGEEKNPEDDIEKSIGDQSKIPDLNAELMMKNTGSKIYTKGNDKSKSNMANSILFQQSNLSNINNINKSEEDKSKGDNSKPDTSKDNRFLNM